MLFNSFHFAIFFPVVLGLYWLMPHKGQNRLLLVASYYFYGCWDWRFLSLILISTFVDYYCGLRIDQTTAQRTKRRFLVISMVANLGILGFFKYFNFFSESLQAALAPLGLSASWPTLNIVLPVGISFYTFQTMSYTIDIYRGKLKPVTSFADFALYVAFFPQLVAGPIERATHLVPQVIRRRSFDWGKIKEGLYLTFSGLFKKVVIADNLAKVADPVFSAPGQYSGWELLLGLYAFAGQIYCDFSGYSDIARGISKMMGFELCLNFNRPYFARNPQEFWRRWHISLSSWLRDYLYISLGGNRKGKIRTYVNLMLTMLLGGLWHGAAWTFVIWGAYQGLLLVVHKAYHEIFPQPEDEAPSRSGTVKNAVITLVFFQFVCLGWLVFRASSLGNMMAYLQGFGRGGVAAPALLMPVLFLGGLLLTVQLWQEWKNDPYVLERLPLWARSACYAAFTYLFVFYGTASKAFIYFQF